MESGTRVGIAKDALGGMNATSNGTLLDTYQRDDGQMIAIVMWDGDESPLEALLSDLVALQ